MSRSRTQSLSAFQYNTIQYNTHTPKVEHNGAISNTVTELAGFYTSDVAQAILTYCDIEKKKSLQWFNVVPNVRWDREHSGFVYLVWWCAVGILYGRSAQTGCHPHIANGLNRDLTPFCTTARTAAPCLSLAPRVHGKSFDWTRTRDVWLPRARIAVRSRPSALSTCCRNRWFHAFIF